MRNDEREQPASEDLRIVYLADHPEALPALEKLLQTEWADYYGIGGPGNAGNDLRAYSNRDHLPVGLLACIGAQPCGMAALKEASLTTHRHFTPWIGGGIVLPRFRRQGIGTRLLLAVEELAQGFGFKEIYAATSTANSLLVRNGWCLLDLASYNGEDVSIYKKML